MKVALVSGSPYSVRGDVLVLVHRLKAVLKDCEFEEIRLKETDQPSDLVHRINACDGMILFCPVLMGGIASGMLSFMVRVQYALKKDLVFGAVVCSVRADRSACRNALGMMKCFAQRARLFYCGGISMTESGLIQPLSKFRFGPFHGFRSAAAALLAAMAGKTETADRFVDFGVPSLLYIRCMQWKWRRMAAKNGVKTHRLKEEDKAVHYL